MGRFTFIIIGRETAACYVWGQWETAPSADTIKESHTHSTALELELDCCPSPSLSCTAQFTFFVHVAIISISLTSILTLQWK
jgi:hypothetical protein